MNELSVEGNTAIKIPNVNIEPDGIIIESLSPYPYEYSDYVEEY